MNLRATATAWAQSVGQEKTASRSRDYGIFHKSQIALAFVSLNAHLRIPIPKSLFEKSFWVKLFALNPSFEEKTRVLPQSRKAYTIQRHIITLFRKPCQINGRGLVPKSRTLGTEPDGLGDSTPTPQCRSLWIDKSTALWDNFLLFKTGS